MQHRKATEIEGIARKVMREHHAMLDQRGPRVEWVMVKPEQPSGSAPDWKIRKVNGVYAYLALAERERPTDWGVNNGNPVRAFFAVEISERYWQILEESQREALCDHVMAHMQYDYEKGTWRVEGPEFGEFEEVLERRSFWRPDRRLLRFAKGMAEQLSLMSEYADQVDEDPDDDPEPDGQESFDVSITYGDRTVETNTETMRRLSEGLADGSVQLGPNGEKVDADTGEVLEPAGART